MSEIKTLRSQFENEIQALCDELQAMASTEVQSTLQDVLSSMKSVISVSTKTAVGKHARDVIKEAMTSVNSSGQHWKKSRLHQPGSPGTLKTETK